MAQAERRREWQFIVTGDEEWQWVARQPDGKEERARSTFPTLKACADDARRNGWASWKSEERRRVDVRRDALP